MASIAFKTINKLYYTLFKKYKHSTKFINMDRSLVSKRCMFILNVKGEFALETNFSTILEEYYLIFNSFENVANRGIFCNKQQRLFSYDLIHFKPKLKNIIKFYIKLLK